MKSKDSMRYVYRVPGSIILNIQKAEATPCVRDGWMDEEKVIPAYNGVLVSLKKEGHSGTYYGVGEPEDIMLSGVASRKRIPYDATHRRCLE